MPKFVVCRGRDAWAIEEAIIEADSIADAEEKVSWKSEARNLDWVATGEYRTFDNTEVMEGEARLLEDGEELEEHITVALTPPQRDIILAALRLWQDVVNDGGEYINDALLEIATNAGSHELLDDVSIDDICEAINA